MSFSFRPLLIVAAALALAGPAAAQETGAGHDGAPASALQDPGSTANGSQAASAVRLGPTLASTALLIPIELARVDAAPTSLPQQSRSSRSVAMMVVGGAGLIVGSVIGGDAGTIIMVGGGVVGLIGLYRYLQ